MELLAQWLWIRLTILQRVNPVADRVVLLQVRTVPTLFLRARSISAINAVKGRRNATLAVVQLVAPFRVPQMLLRGLDATLLGTLVVVVLGGQQQTRIDLLAGHATRSQDLPHAPSARPCRQTLVLLREPRTRARRVLDHVHDHLPVKPSVDVQGLVENHRRVTESRQIHF